MSIPDLFEIKQNMMGEICYKCGNNQSPLVPIDPQINYFLPCWECTTNKYEKQQALGMIKEAIKDYYGKIVGDRYYQLFLIDDIYFQTTLTHRFPEFKEVLKLLPQKDRNKIFFIDFVPGYPHLICPTNISGLRIIMIDDLYEVNSNKEQLSLNSWNVNFPKILPYDSRHRSRYNIFNKSEPGRTKMLRLESRGGNCIRFFNNDISCKSIFNVPNIDKMKRQDLLVLKLVLLRNKTYIKLIFEIIQELIKGVGVLRDSVFLRNTVTINPDIDIKVSITWLPEYREDYINISIL